MIEQQEMRVVTAPELVQAVSRMCAEGYRLVQIGATRLADFEVVYSFDREYHFVTLKVIVPAAAPALPSVSSACPCAFLYENEIQDLFGIIFSGISVDYKGKFYRTSSKNPFNVAPAASESPQSQGK